ncbi:hypothetical protein EMIT0P74_60026 [Pseudomonas sp. IT-P74]
MSGGFFISDPVFLVPVRSSSRAGLAPTGECISNVGASLLAMGPGQATQDDQPKTSLAT